MVIEPWMLSEARSLASFEVNSVADGLMNNFVRAAESQFVEPGRDAESQLVEPRRAAESQFVEPGRAAESQLVESGRAAESDAPP